MQVLTRGPYCNSVYVSQRDRPGESYLLLHIMVNFKGSIKELLKKKVSGEFLDAPILT